MKNYITVVGLGPGNPKDMTLEAQKTLQRAQDLWLRTKKHPSVASLPAHLAIYSFDDLYEQMDDFTSIYKTIAHRLIALCREDRADERDVVYAVPGHPLVAEASVRYLLQLAAREEVEIYIVGGLSFIEPVCTALRLDPLENGLQILDATELAAELEFPGEGRGHLINPNRPSLICQLYSKRVASALKLSLMEIYPDEHPVTIVRGAGLGESEEVISLPLFQIDQQEESKLDHLAVLYLPALERLANLRSFSTAQYISARLRGPGGCPWDIEQTHASLRPYIIEEAYEVLEALDEGDPDKIAGELGDLLWQAMIHSQLGTDEGSFTIEDVLGHINSKLIRRHPHVFGTAVVSGTSDVLRNWEAIKKEERAAQAKKEGKIEEADFPSLLKNISMQMPALGYAQEAQKRAARVGFDWPNIDGVLAKIEEEIEELRTATSDKNRAEELGDIFFTLVNLARRLDFDAETILRDANRKFRKRFEMMERLCANEDVDLSKLSPDEFDALWQQAKQFTASN